MKINKNLIISIDLFSELTYELQSIESLAERLNTTTYFLSQQVSRLGKAGLVYVRKGPKGGVSLSRMSTSEITALDVYKAISNTPHEVVNNKTHARLKEIFNRSLDSFVVAGPQETTSSYELGTSRESIHASGFDNN